MKKIFVYDLPTRIFHWVFALLFTSAFFIAKTVDDESTLYPFHMLLGVTLGVTVLLRILWGVFGSTNARFSSFALNPSELLNYFKDLLQKKTKLYLSHNPASSWTTILMMILALALGLSGYMMVQGQNKDFYEEIHELAANLFIAIVIFHIVGIIIHTIRHKDPIALSMITGYKSLPVNNVDENKKSHWLFGMILVLSIGIFASYLFKNYDSNIGKLTVFGKEFQLSEVEEKGEMEDD